MSRDKFVLSMINNRVLDGNDFETTNVGGVYLKEASRKKFFEHWQRKSKEIITHPFLGEKIEWGLVPYSQALLLSRYIRGDLDDYPPFIWR